MKNKIFIFTILFSSTFLTAQAPDTLWTRTYGGENSDDGRSVIETSDGGYVITGYTSSYGNGSADVWLIKTDINGDTLWTQTYGSERDDFGYSVIETVDGGYVITGSTSSYVNGGDDVWLIKTDINGDTLWTQTYGGEGSEFAVSVTETSNGGYVITGSTLSYVNGGDDVWLIKTDINGDTLWTQTYGGERDDCGYSVIETGDGGYVITGYTSSYGNDSYDALLIKADINGDALWMHAYGGENDDRGRSVIETVDGGYVITGYTSSYGNDSYDALLIKADINGDTLWTQTYGGESDDFGFSLIETSDGGYVIAGYTESFGNGSSDVWLIKTQPIGPTIVSEGILDGEIRLSWSEEYFDRDLYRIYRKEDGGSFVRIDSVVGSPPDTFYVDTTVQNGTTYTYKITSVTNSTESAFSNEVSGTPNAAPVLTSIMDQTTVEDSAIIITLDVYDPDEDQIAFQANTNENEVLASIDGYSITLTPYTDWFRISEIEVIANDYSLSDTISFQLTISPVNDVPVIDPINDQITQEETPFEFTINATDVENDVLSYSAISDTNSVHVYINENSLTLTPILNWIGVAAITISVSDAEFQVFESFTLTVTKVNDAPTINTLSNQIILEDKILVIHPSATDVDHDSMAFSAFETAGVISISSSDTSIVFSPIQDWFGVLPIGVVVTDGELSDSTYFDLTVTKVNDQPTAHDANLPVQEATTAILTLEGLTGPENESAQSLSYIITGIPSEGFLSDVEGGTALTIQDMPFTLSSDTVYFRQDERFEVTSFWFQVRDDGGTDNGGVNLSDTAAVSLALNVPYLFSLTTNGSVDGGVTVIDDNILYVASS